MSFETVGLAVGILVTMAMVAYVVARPGVATTPAGKTIAFFALFLLPLLMLAGGTKHHLVVSKKTEFCLSCHVMNDYGQSLYIADADYLPAMHYQNKWVPKDEACFTCHTQYAMFGDMKAKLNGFKHLLVNYVGTIPEEIELYAPYQNRECLHCHGDARSFEESELHVDFIDELRRGEISCLECHDLVHAVSEIESLDKWDPEAVP